MSENCIFCRIARGEIPAEKILETDHTVVFKDIHPVAPVHYLAVPKKHIDHLDKADPKDAAILADVLLSLAEAARKAGVVDAGYRVIANTNRDAGQEVFHLHFHLLAGRRMGHMG